MLSFGRGKIALLSEPSLQLVGLRFAEEYSSFSLFVAAVSGVVVGGAEIGDRFVGLHALVVLQVFVEVLVQVDAFRFHGAGGVGVQKAGRAGGVRDVRDARRCAVGTGLLLVVDVCAETWKQKEDILVVGT